MSTSWRYRCPEGHTLGSIRQRAGNSKYPYYCRQCEQLYRNLVDQKTGKEHR